MKLLHVGMYSYTPAPLAFWMFQRYYSKWRYPYLHKFETYYVEKMELHEEFDKVKITWAHHKEPKVFEVKLEKFK